MLTPLLLMILAILKKEILCRLVSKSEKLVSLKIINSSTQRILSIIKPPIRNNSISAIKVTNKPPYPKPSTSANNTKNVKDPSIPKVTAHPPTLLHPSLLSMTDGVNLILPIIQFYHHKVHLLVIR